MTADQSVSQGGTLMEVLYRSCCGIDAHKQFLVACLLVVDEAGCQHKELRRFSTMTLDMLTCLDWLKAAQCRAIAMESTGVYWKSPWNLMEGHFEIVMIVEEQPANVMPWHWRCVDKSVTIIVCCCVNFWK
jgi:transposase